MGSGWETSAPEKALATQQMTMKPQMTVQSAVGDIGQTKANDDYDETVNKT